MSLAPPMISALALGDMPDFVLSELGEGGLAAAFDHARLPPQIYDHKDGFILEDSLVNFVDYAARRLGQDKLGLLMAPFLTVRDYGVWGEFVLSAPTLGEAILRSCNGIRYHGSQDRLHVWSGEGEVRYSYLFSRSGEVGYPNIAYCGAGVMLSVMRSYLGRAWSPKRIAFNIHKPPGAHLVEDAFGCPVIYEAPDVTILFDEPLMKVQRLPGPGPSIVTIHDVIRDRTGGPPQTIAEAVSELIRKQLMNQNVEIESVAASMRISIRALQRRLNSDGANFRQLVKRVRIERAMECLKGSAATVTSISNDLGYANPTHFTRAFKATVGTTPRIFREN